MRVLIADDHDLVRETIAAFLRSEDGCEVVCVSDLAGALGKVHAEAPFDLILLDYSMPGMNGLEGLEQVKDASAGCPVALLSGSASPEIARAALQVGARGFIPKTLSAQSMLSAVRFMVAGEVFAPFEFLEGQVDASETLLTTRERDVLQGIAAGKSNKEIARDFDLQEVTVKLHVKTLSRKLEARNRTHAAMIARDRGLI